MGASPRLPQRDRQVTGLIDRMKVGDLDKGGVGMGELADTIEALSDNFTRAVRPGGGQQSAGRDHGGGAAEQCSARAGGGAVGPAGGRLDAGRTHLEQLRIEGGT
ncbi:hypothetical protein [Stenotrophomonas maltophilia]|uniref:hypothetical protein n=1 Tax=Stenotrophomonas maltophilia TaxID=40324 RepID=UPI0012DB7620|nr:hypothetical protein [Stenotrophomonas maltophilia]